MKKYAIITNEQTKSVAIGEKGSVEFFKSIGMTEMDIEQAYNGSWYLAGYCPEKPQEEKEKDVRNVRNQYLEKYVDPYQMVIRWNTLKEENQNNIINYRQYLLDYTTSSDNWFEQNPLTYDEWLLTI